MVIKIEANKKSYLVMHLMPLSFKYTFYTD